MRIEFRGGRGCFQYVMEQDEAESRIRVRRKLDYEQEGLVFAGALAGLVPPGLEAMLGSGVDTQAWRPALREQEQIAAASEV